jgi:hypothetical protein
MLKCTKVNCNQVSRVLGIAGTLSDQHWFKSRYTSQDATDCITQNTPEVPSPSIMMLETAERRRYLCVGRSLLAVEDDDDRGGGSHDESHGVPPEKRTCAPYAC